jgi:hypothetical protein
MISGYLFFIKQDDLALPKTYAGLTKHIGGPRVENP